MIDRVVCCVWGVGVVFGFLIACFLFDGCVAA